MYCLFCKHKDTEVIETRLVDEGGSIRRRRVCPQCEKRFTTYERVEEFPVLVVKKDGKRERFNREKLRIGLQKSCEKTLVSATQIEQIISFVEQGLRNKDVSEVDSTKVGELVAEGLKKIDKVAYIRFASVFKRFEELNDFKKEIEAI